ncbi:unnamed protein product [Orchesella dallaii]|uniref:long-chain-alcohol O-fatty-acyltransferase n=1 Tax=Orchesella dallaii TaxID=48710 RepID=A0ABP1QUV5_9HEXA
MIQDEVKMDSSKVKKKPLEILYDGYYYDVTDFVRRHPGGREIIGFFTHPNEDATIPMQQFHSRAFDKVEGILKALKRRPATETIEISSEEKKILTKNKALTEDFTTLYLELKAEGLFEPSYSHMAYRLTEMLLLVLLGLYFITGYSHFWIKVMGCLFFSLGQIRLTWIMHEGGHHSLTGNPKHDRKLQSYLYGILFGWSGINWRRHHNLHHAMTQRLKRDIDLDLAPAFLVNINALEDSKGRTTFFYRHQFILSPILSVGMGFYFIWETWKSLIKYRVPGEIFAIGLHYLGVYYVGFWPCLISYILAQSYFTFNIGLSHTHLPVTNKPTHWVEHGLVHTVDVEHRPWCDWWMGYLNYQIEHHLFPTMPQFRNKLAVSRVRALAQKHGLPYEVLSYKEVTIRTIKNILEEIDWVSHEIISNSVNDRFLLVSRKVALHLFVMDSTRQKFVEARKKILLVTLTIFVILIGYPVATLVIIPLLAYRRIIEYFAKKADPKFSSIQKGLDAILSAHTPYSSPTAVFLPTFYLKSQLDKSQLINYFDEKLMQLRNPDGKFIYEKFRQKIVSKFGFHFWVNVDDFNLNDHIRFFNESSPEQVVKEEDLIPLSRELSRRPFNPSGSPWEFLLIPRFEHNGDPSIKSLLIMRYHHCLCDGFSFVKVFERLGFIPWKTLGVAGQQPKKRRQLMPTLCFLVGAPYEALNTFLFTNDDNEWIQKVVKEPTRLVVCNQARIFLKDLKNISLSFPRGEKISISSILATIIAEASVRAMARRNVKGNMNKVHLILPWPLPNHPGEGLYNHWTSVKIPIYRDSENVRNTLRNVNREYERIRHGIIWQTSAVLTELVGYLPIRLIPNADDLVKSSCLISTFPGPGHVTDICGAEVKDMFVVASPARGTAVASLFFSYKDQFRFVIGGDTCNLDEKDADFLTESCQKLVEELKKH